MLSQDSKNVTADTTPPKPTETPADEVTDVPPISPECLKNSLQSKRICAALLSANARGRVTYSTTITDATGKESDYVIVADQISEEPYAKGQDTCAMFETNSIKVKESGLPTVNPQGETELFELCLPPVK